MDLYESEASLVYSKFQASQCYLVKLSQNNKALVHEAEGDDETREQQQGAEKDRDTR